MKGRENRIPAPCTKSVTEDNCHYNPRELGPFLDCNLKRLLYGFSKLALRLPLQSTRTGTFLRLQS